MSEHRWLPLTDEDRREMLADIGLSSETELFADMPDGMLLQKPLDLPPAHSELELRKRFEVLESFNRRMLCFVGAGAYDHYRPSVIDAVLSRSEFFTSYTPYQAELSQGMLQAIYEYQSFICRLSDMEATNASMYDGAGALAEAALMACDVTGRSRVAVSAAVHPHYRETMRTYLGGQGLELLEVPLRDGRLDAAAALDLVDGGLAALALQTPNFFGLLETGLEALRQELSQQGSLLIICADPISLAVCRTPGETGADLAVGEGQPLGIPLNCGGPYLGWLACRREHLRRLPGRIVGATTDSGGQRAFVLTLQAREQHIRRHKATSNICSNEALMALAATVYLSCMGPSGLQEAAWQCLHKAAYAREKLLDLPGFEAPFDGPFFREFVLRLPVHADDVCARLAESGIACGLPLGRFYPDMEDCLLVCVTEKRTRAEIDRLVEELSEWKG